MRFQTLALLLGLYGALAVAAGAQDTPAPKPVPEPPGLRYDLATGELPPLAERLPAEPRRDLPGREGWQSGRYGGSLVMLARGGRDARDLALFGYARLVAWDEKLELVPDILKDVQVQDERVFTLTLRAGHRWSDGTPFTTEDVRFWWEDVANNAGLSPRGLPPELLAKGQPPKVEFVDATQVRFSWPAPNPRFLPALAAASPLFIYRPAHYLKQFHANYAAPEELNRQAQAIGLAGWAELFHRKDRMFFFDNPELPTLQPWVNTSAPPAERFVARRNPYFHRVDGAGRQLPYIDEVILDRTEPRLIAAKTAAGEIGLQARGLTFRDGAVLKQAEKEGRIKLRLWPIGRGSQLALYPNLNAAAPGWRDVLREARFRRALSLATDRDELNQVLYQGTALPGANTLLPGSPLYKEDYRSAWASYDPEQANQLLDGLGMTWKDPDGIRHLPDGRRADMVIETAEADPAEADALEIIKSQWAKIGIAVLVRSQPRQAARQRIGSGATVMSVFYGLANGLATPAMSPAELAPTSEKQNNWPLWGLHYESGGDAGEAPALPAARRLLALYEDWRLATDEATRSNIWQQMLKLHAEQVFTIGLLGAVQQPVAADPRLRNLPDKADYIYEPGAYFGRYRMDTLWFAGK
ncbi:ABC transporter substrate-binding protein [Pelagibius marinus]|uniref:ABC transporter substrate-binding protein n=1 Tax=Pelagibius marinus TaxID=2762760 RepID=UPI0018731E9A|nr:ABC transporter substrate-binding protein [Pelagibius marinus]